MYTEKIKLLVKIRKYNRVSIFLIHSIPDGVMELPEPVPTTVWQKQRTPWTGRQSVQGNQSLPLTHAHLGTIKSNQLNS